MRQLRDAPVRDLAWLLLSADLLCHRTFPVAVAQVSRTEADATDVAQWLGSLDTASGPLRTFLAAGKSPRLGHYAERLLHFYLSHGPGYRLLAAGLQIRDMRRGGATLGECDFLVEHLRDGALLHWELAVKLYLYVPGTGNAARGADKTAAHWLGPNLADSLDAKVRRLVQHQLRLTGHEAARASLPAPGPWVPQALVKGWLFYPLGDGAAPLPDVVSPDHARGWWGTLDAWGSHVANRQEWSDVRWALLPRARWLAPNRCPLVDTVPSHDALRATVASLWRSQTMPEPVMAVAFNAGEAGDVADGFECSRGFIVPAGWQARAQQRIADLSSAAGH